MRAQDIMTPNPAVCTPDTGLREVAQLMVDNDCGEIPVVDDAKNMRPAGVVTDRDIVTRVVARGRNPVEVKAQDVMTTPVVSVSYDEDVDKVRDRMEDHQLRRIVVADENQRVCGIISLADVARDVSKKDAGTTVRRVSEPSAGGPTVRP